MYLDESLILGPQPEAGVIEDRGQSPGHRAHEDVLMVRSILVSVHYGQHLLEKLLDDVISAATQDLNNQPRKERFSNAQVSPHAWQTGIE